MRIAAVMVLALAGLGWWAAPSKSDDRQLEAIVGTNDGYDIGLFFPNGDRVVTLEPGTYTIVVHDRSAIHDFHLASNTDSTVNFRTDVPFVGDQTFTVTFRPNTRYAYACEPHWQVMNGEFTTLSAPATTPSVPTVKARLSASGAVSLSPASVRAGTVRVTVADTSKKFGLHLAGAGVKRSTSASYVGTTTWTVRLAAGMYRATGAPGRPAGILRAR